MEIRAERVGDEQAISTLISAAFLAAEHSGGNEAGIVAALRASQNLTVSLVAACGDDIIGHIAFSPVTIDGVHGDWFGLAPVAVMPAHQREGVGAALIQHGLARLRTQGAMGCVVLGDPRFYGKFGFVPDPTYRLSGASPEYFQCLAFSDAPGSGGAVRYCAAFGDS